MRILFEITHPKHVHLFRNSILELKKKDHEIAVTTREKDITTTLLSEYGIPYTILSRQQSGFVGLGMELLIRDWRLWRFSMQFRPDVFVGRVGPSAAHIGRLLNRPVIIFEDTEDGNLQQRISFPFATKICTAEHYEKDWGIKHIRYQSFDELAYLHPKRFTPDRDLVQDIGLEPYKYIIVRFVSWKAAHDVGQKGISASRKVNFLKRLEKYGKVFVTSESPLPDEFGRFRLPIKPIDFHHVLAFARLSFGESSTVTTEAVMLGVPAVLVNTMNWGSINRLREYYKLVYQTTSEEEGFEFARTLLEDNDTLKKWRLRRKKLLCQEIDLTNWMVKTIENYC